MSQVNDIAGDGDNGNESSLDRDVEGGGGVVTL